MTTAPDADAFYLPLGDDRYASTRHTGGPWDPMLQHAGPPSALLTRAIERQPGPWAATVTRVTVDLLGPVPVAELDLRVEVLRSGRSVELVRAELANDGRVAARATAWRVRRAELDLPELPPDHDEASGDEVPPMPGAETPLPGGWSGGYLQAMEWRQARGNWGPPGAAAVWGRMRYPLVPDEVPSGLQRVMAIADSGNGISHVLPFETWFFINPDLTVHLAAEPSGDWICLDARTRVDAAGFGLASSRLFDKDRLVARGAQTLYIGPR
ncbi:MAG TPA: thioesterase family protein [Mycobacteriales bacterium]|nr:thioesterase family protein [Mycobacteriales bacterium]